MTDELILPPEPELVDINGAALDPQEPPLEEPELSYADVAAAAVTALETIVEMLPDQLAAEVIAAFERRSAAYRGDLTVPDDV